MRYNSTTQLNHEGKPDLRIHTDEATDNLPNESSKMIPALVMFWSMTILRITWTALSIGGRTWMRYFFSSIDKSRHTLGRRMLLSEKTVLYTVTSVNPIKLNVSENCTYEHVGIYVF